MTDANNGTTAAAAPSLLPTFLSHYTQCDLPPRALSQYVSRVVYTDGGGGKARKGVYARSQIDRGYVIAFEGDNVFSTIVSTSEGLHRRETALRERQERALLEAVGGDEHPSKVTAVGAKRSREEEEPSVGVSSSDSSSSSSDAEDDSGAEADTNKTSRGGRRGGPSDARKKRSNATRKKADPLTISQVTIPNCRLVCLMPRDPLLAKPLRLVMTTTQVFPQQLLYCCVRSIDRCKDEVRWAAAQWALQERTNNTADVVGTRGGGSGTAATVQLSSAAVRKKQSLLEAPLPIGPYWPQGVPYYHGIGELHRDGYLRTVGGGSGGVAAANEGAANTITSTPQLHYPYNLLRLQPCPHMGEGQLEVVAAAPIPAYTCFAYAGPVCDKTTISTKESPYFLTLQSTMTVLGQGITRYFNHRYRCDAFGNAQFSSVSIPIVKGMRVEVTEKDLLAEAEEAAAAEPAEHKQQRQRDGSEPPTAATSRGASRAKSTAPGAKGKGKSVAGASKKASHQQRRSTTPPPQRTATNTASVRDGGDLASSSSSISLMTIPFFMTARDIAVGEPLLATSYGTAYDAQLERQVFGGRDVPLPPYLHYWQQWERYLQQQQDGNEGSSSSPPAPLFDDYEGDFRWDVRAGDFVVRVMSEEEKGFFCGGGEAEVAVTTNGTEEPPASTSIFVVRDVDAEANVMLLAPLIPRVVELPRRLLGMGGVGNSNSADRLPPSTNTNKPTTNTNTAIPREYLVPSSDEDTYRIIAHYSTIAPLYGEDDYDASRIGGAVMSIVLKEVVAAAVGTYPSPADVPEGLHVTNALVVGGGAIDYDAALDGCLWPLYAGITADEAANRKVTKHADDE